MWAAFGDLTDVLDCTSHDGASPGYETRKEVVAVGGRVDGERRERYASLGGREKRIG